MKYRKKPVVIEATQWFKIGDHVEVEAAPIVNGYAICTLCQIDMQHHGQVKTLETFDGSSKHRVCPGDWIITGVKGEHYACKPDIFAATYEPADTPPGTEATPPQGERVKEAALAMYDAMYRDINVTPKGRTTPHEMQMAFQQLGEALGLIGTASAGLDGIEKGGGGV